MKQRHYSAKADGGMKRKIGGTLCARSLRQRWLERKSKVQLRRARRVHDLTEDEERRRIAPIAVGVAEVRAVGHVEHVDIGLQRAAPAQLERVAAANAQQHLIRTSGAAEPGDVFDRDRVTVARSAAIRTGGQRLFELAVAVGIGVAVGQRARRSALILERSAPLQPAGLWNLRGAGQ